MPQGDVMHFPSIAPLDHSIERELRACKKSADAAWIEACEAKAYAADYDKQMWKHIANNTDEWPYAARRLLAHDEADRLEMVYEALAQMLRRVERRHDRWQARQNAKSKAG
jgi:hypothetical protein